MAKEETKYALCPYCGYKSEILLQGEQAKALGGKLSFPCINCSSPIFVTNKAEYEAAPLAASQTKANLAPEKETVRRSSMGLTDLQELVYQRVMHSADEDPIRLSVVAVIDVLERTGLLSQGTVKR